MEIRNGLVGRGRLGLGFDLLHEHALHELLRIRELIHLRREGFEGAFEAKGAGLTAPGGQRGGWQRFRTGGRIDDESGQGDPAGELAVGDANRVRGGDAGTVEVECS